MPPAAGAVLTAASLAVLLGAGARGHLRVAGAAKVAASLGFLWFAVALGAASTTYGRIVLGSLACGFVGDVLLISKDRKLLKLGLWVFLAGHLGYVLAFAYRGLSPLAAAASAVVLVAPAALVLRWLRPHAGDLRGPVRAYVAVISVMLAAAAGTAAGPGPWWLAVAGLLFYLSDLLVARHRFVSPGFVNRAIGLPLYYAAQLLLAASVLYR